MNKSELVSAIAAKTGATKKGAEESLNALVSVVTDALVKGDKVIITGGFPNTGIRKTTNLLKIEEI